MNKTIELMEKRYSCRAYSDRIPEREKLEAIALSAVQSPSAFGAQPWKVIVINNKSFIDEMDADGMDMMKLPENKHFYDLLMSRGGKMFYNAPCMYVILVENNRQLDIGIVSQSIVLSAASLGLGSTICGAAAIPLEGPNGELYKSKIGCSEKWKFGVAVLVGYASDNGTPNKPDTSKIHFIE